MPTMKWSHVYLEDSSREVSDALVSSMCDEWLLTQEFRGSRFCRLSSYSKHPSLKLVAPKNNTYLLHRNSDEEKCYIKIVALDAIYNFVVEKFFIWNCLESTQIFEI
jgi:hypothetical protein